jgi:hypothetical protein
MNLVIFIPGYLTTQTCEYPGDTYVDLARYIRRRERTEFVYVPIPNNNYADLGNTTMDDCLEYVIRQYNRICADRDQQDTIILAGHSMGGVLIARMLTISMITRLHRRPRFVRLLNPSLHPIVPITGRILSMILSRLPTLVLDYVIGPVSIASDAELYPASPRVIRYSKLRLIQSLLGVTGELWPTTNAWDLTPDPGMCPDICMIVCSRDRLVSAEHTRLFSNIHRIRVVTVASGYHEYFDNTMMYSFFDQVEDTRTQ